MTTLIEGNNGYNVIDPIEEEALRITKPQADKVWEKVRETLKKAKHLKLNITREWKMFNKIRGVMLKSVDKGNATLLIEKKNSLT